MLAVGITLTEYIRRRKLSCAALDLKNTNLNVIDIAMKYGYNSQDAFSVAFKRLYGILPAQARQSKN
ncbi:MAG: helix-turn-helix transcriptional regulator [Clostridiales bacterium]|jgi:AraC family transcriptional regulator|nr:helix-turn-helix transcriptional regulator [Clostridiales bacterium]